MSLQRRSVLGVLVLCLVLVGTVNAQAQGNSGNRPNRLATTTNIDGDWGGLSALRTYVAALVAQIEQSQQKIAQLEAALSSEISSRQAGDAALQAAIASLKPGLTQADLDAAIAREAAERAAADLTFAPLSSVTPLTALVPLASYVTVDTGTINGLAGPHVIFSGANVHVRNGDAWGDSLAANGRGNLVIGYNEDGGYSPTERSGSHTLVIGPYHRYNFAVGLVSGYASRLGNIGASVTGGAANEASGMLSSVSGGSNNRAAGQYSSVSGGDSNHAGGNTAAVSAGQMNTASGSLSSVLGGFKNTASATTSTVSGGVNNTAGATNSTVGGGNGVANVDANTFVP